MGQHTSPFTHLIILFPKTFQNHLSSAIIRVNKASHKIKVILFIFWARCVGSLSQKEQFSRKIFVTPNHITRRRQAISSLFSNKIITKRQKQRTETLLQLFQILGSSFRDLT